MSSVCLSYPLRPLALIKGLAKQLLPVIYGHVLYVLVHWRGQAVSDDFSLQCCLAVLKTPAAYSTCCTSAANTSYPHTPGSSPSNTAFASDTTHSSHPYYVAYVTPAHMPDSWAFAAHLSNTSTAAAAARTLPTEYWVAMCWAADMPYSSAAVATKTPLATVSSDSTC